MLEFPAIPFDLHAARARELRAQAMADLIARVVAFFRRETECDDCGKPVVIS